MKDKQDQLINYGTAEADKIFLKILVDYPELDENDLRRSSLIFAMFTNCVQYLHMKGWSEKELINEVFSHCETAREYDYDEDDE